VHMGMVLPRFMAVMLVRTSSINEMSSISVLSCRKRTSFPTAIPSIKLAGYFFRILYISESCRCRVVAFVSTHTPTNTVIFTRTSNRESYRIPCGPLRESLPSSDSSGNHTRHYDSEPSRQRESRESLRSMRIPRRIPRALATARIPAALRQHESENPW
jgi:hypothetical protein